MNESCEDMSTSDMGLCEDLIQPRSSLDHVQMSLCVKGECNFREFTESRSL